MVKPTAKEPCVFCKIVAGEVPSYKVYEDDEVLAFLDVNPVNPGHLLVVPKAHYKTITDMPKDLYEEIAEKVWELSLKMQKALDPDGMNIVQNNNEHAGQLVPHYHVHVIPRYSGDSDRYIEEWKTKDLSKEEMKEVQAKLQS
ncbi:HIT domain-containing protein [archaeon]|nr:HIT domain-containing protein [archaeon]